MSQKLIWEQNFNYYTIALEKLSEAVLLSKQKDLSELEIEGMIQRFEYTYELAWKTLQDIIKFRGYHAIYGPGPVLNQAFIMGLINNSEGWRSMKKNMELTGYSYDKKNANEIAKAIVDEYLALFVFLQKKLEKEKESDVGNLFT